MTELILEFAADYGIPLLLVVTFLSCLALPVPSSLLMLASGGFAASGDLTLWSVMLAAFVGAVLGDNLGYWIAHHFNLRFSDWLDRNAKRATLRKRAAEYMDRYGGISVFFTRWLVAPLGPYMNYAAGLAGFAWPRFALWSMVGEVVWVCTYVGLGYLFADNITAISTLLGNLSGFLAALVVAGGLVIWMVKSSRLREAREARKAKRAKNCKRRA
jgi:membrane protein DedA with SNARE-associated domain